jgi:hypothetical protein
LAERAGLSASGTWAAGQSRAISYYAIDHDLTLKEAALAKGVPEDLYDKVVIPLNLTRPAPPTCPPDKGAGPCAPD